MTKNKTEFTDKNVDDFLQTLESEQKRKDSYELIALMEKITGEKAKMWGSTIVGFGNYHYKYESGYEGNAPLIGFSPRKTAISLYVFTGLQEHEHMLENLGKFTMGKACIYVKRLTDINLDALTGLLNHSIDYVSAKYTRIKE